MKKVRSMIGMPVICRREKVGRMIQADLAKDLKQMNGIWIDGGLRGTRYISAENLEMLGDIAIMADTQGSRGKLSPSPVFFRAISTDGRRLGAITGAEINELSFIVESLELSNGVWDDLFNRRVRVTHYTVNIKTGDVIIDDGENEKEDTLHEERNDQGADHRNVDRRFSSYDLRRNELEDRKRLEYESPENWSMDFK